MSPSSVEVDVAVGVVVTSVGVGLRVLPLDVRPDVGVTVGSRVCSEVGTPVGVGVQLGVSLGGSPGVRLGVVPGDRVGVVAVGDGVGAALVGNRSSVIVLNGTESPAASADPSPPRSISHIAGTTRDSTPLTATAGFRNADCALRRALLAAFAIPADFPSRSPRDAGSRPAAVPSSPHVAGDRRDVTAWRVRW